MLGRSRLCEVCTGALRCRDSSIAVPIEGGAEADRAINGTLATALKPPMLLKAPRNSGPSHSILIDHSDLYLTIQECSELHPLQPRLIPS
jgi:hypothetical protein